jgi:hypothetical protein
MIVVVALLLLVVVIRLLWVLRQKGYSQAALLVFLVPVLYLAGVWTLTNWLIMGNPLFFLRGLFAGASLLPPHWHSSVAWHLYLLAPLLLLLGLLFGRLTRAGRLVAVTLGPLVVLAMAVVVGFPYFLELSARASYLEIYPQQVRTVDEIISFVEDRYPDARVVVGGYYGYVFRERSHPDAQGKRELFVHFINLSLSAVDRRTHGKELFLLLPRPEGMRTWEDIFLNHPGLFTGYERYRIYEGTFVAGFLFEQSWPADDGRPQWLLLRMILRRAGESS